MEQYLSSDQLYILASSYKASGYRTATQLINGRQSIKAAFVESIYHEGYFRKRGSRYRLHARGEKALRDHGFDLESIQPETPLLKKPKKMPKPTPEKILSDHMEMSDRTKSIVSNRSNMQKIRLHTAIKKARAGDPWDLIRLQWPFLIIKDELDLRYFKKHCKRTKHLDLRLDDTQVELIDHAFNPAIKEIAIKGSTSPGKGFATALLINVWYQVYGDRIILLSQSSKHAKDVMFAEVMTLRKEVRFKDHCNDLTAEIKDPEDPKHFITIANPETGEGLSGGHGPHVLFVFDEMSSIPSDLPVNARKQAGLIVYISNPRVLSGFFYDLYPKENPDVNQVWMDRGWNRACLTFGGHGALNVRAKRLHVPYAPEGGYEGETIDGQRFTVAEGQKVPDIYLPHVRALIPGQMDWSKYSTIMKSPNEIERAWSGEGKFPPEDADLQIILPSWLNHPREVWKNHRDEIEVNAFGLDLGGSDEGDDTALASGGQLGCKDLRRTKKSNSMELYRWVLIQASDHGIDLTDGSVPVAIDVIGAGGNVMADMMEEKGIWVIRIDVRKTANNTSIYANTRAELYGDFGERVDPSQDHFGVFAIPDDEELVKELIAHERHYVSDNKKFFVTPKTKTPEATRKGIQSIKEKIGHSPDSSDALVMLYRAVMETALDGNVVNQFDPRKVIEAVVSTSNQEEYLIADGSYVEADPDSYNTLITIESEMEAFRKAISTLNFR